jgi:hypothetical protein
MKKLLLIFVAFMLSGCVAYPLYDDGYYPDYGPYPYGYVGPNVNLFVSGFHGGHDFHGGGRRAGGRRWYADICYGV